MIMNTLMEMPAGCGVEVELVTFYVNGLLLGAEIRYVEEINRHLDFTPVPDAPESVRGVMNLRGEVVTVLDLRTILGLGRTEAAKDTRNVILSVAGERTGLLVDRIADVVNARRDAIEASPANVTGVEGRFFQGVHKLERELLMVLNVAEVLSETSEAH